MSGRLKIQRLRKEFLAARVADMVKSNPLSCVVQTGNLSMPERTAVRQAVQAVGGEITFIKNSVTIKGLELAGGPAMSLAPALKGPTALASGPAEVPLAHALKTLSKELPDFFVLGALLDSQRLLQFWEVDRLGGLPEPEVIHSSMVAAMLPGSCLQVPDVAAHLHFVLEQRVAQLEAEAGGSGSGS